MSFPALMYARSFIPLATLFVALVLFFTLPLSLSLFPRAASRGWGVSRSSRRNQISVRRSRTKTEKFRKVCLKTNPFVSPLRHLPTAGLLAAVERWWNRVAILRAGRTKPPSAVNTVRFRVELSSWDFANLIRSGFVSAQTNFPNASQRANGFTRN